MVLSTSHAQTNVFDDVIATSPDHNYLEAWCDHNPATGHYSIQQPLIRPLYNTRQAQESLMVWAGMAQRTNSESEAFYNFIKKHWLANQIGNQEEYFDFCEILIGDSG